MAAWNDYVYPMITKTESAPDDRPLGSALRLGWALRCPACGEGAMMDGYLTVRDACPACGEALHHHRADDGPAWATILVAGHVMAPLMLFVYELWEPSPLVMMLGLSTLFVSLSLYLLPRFKGAFVGAQWSRRMHGFGGGSESAPRP